MMPSAPYDAFAWFYYRYWNEEFHSLAFPILERIWLAHVPARAHILDVCCGTGYLARLLIERGYSVTGIDASPEMIRYARDHVPGARFHVADASSFTLPRTYQAAVSTFDSLNHILNLDDLGRAFHNTASALKRGGLFAFDMLLEEAYQTHWGEHYALVRDDHVLTITGGGYDFRTHTAQCRLTMFRLIDDAWQRFDTEVRERCYTSAEIDGALAAAGFGEITSYDARDLGMGGDLGVGRTFWVAKKR
jgi:SAM-dependent methyltransferase